MKLLRTTAPWVVGSMAVIGIAAVVFAEFPLYQGTLSMDSTRGIVTFIGMCLLSVAGWSSIPLFFASHVKGQFAQETLHDGFIYLLGLSLALSGMIALFYRGFEGNSPFLFVFLGSFLLLGATYLVTILACSFEDV